MLLHCASEYLCHGEGEKEIKEKIHKNPRRDSSEELSRLFKSARGLLLRVTANFRILWQEAKTIPDILGVNCDEASIEGTFAFLKENAPLRI